MAMRPFEWRATKNTSMLALSLAGLRWQALD
jgi:hypothetical protein